MFDLMTPGYPYHDLKSPGTAKKSHRRDARSAELIPARRRLRHLGKHAFGRGAIYVTREVSYLYLHNIQRCRWKCSQMEIRA